MDQEFEKYCGFLYSPRRRDRIFIDATNYAIGRVIPWGAEYAKYNVGGPSTV